MDEARSDDERAGGVERGVSLVDEHVGVEHESSVSASSSSYAAELVQSAARSLLDTSATLLSDDEDSGPSPSSSAALASLQTEKMPALPDELDRKRFIVRFIKMTSLHSYTNNSHLLFLYIIGMSCFHIGVFL
jgi:hypothetical protein